MQPSYEVRDDTHHTNDRLDMILDERGMRRFVNLIETWVAPNNEKKMARVTLSQHCDLSNVIEVINAIPTGLKAADITVDTRQEGHLLTFEVIAHV